MLCQDRTAMKPFAFAVVALLATTAASAQIYEWKDAQGKTHYSDHPPVGTTPVQKIAAPESPTTSSPAQKTMADQELEFRKRQKNAQENADKANKEKTASVDRKESCDNAQRMLEMLGSGERIALRDNQGERYYMDDIQRQQETAKTRQFIQANCKP
jgi:hypothetical protein